MGEALVCGAPWDRRSTVGGCVRDACMREAHGCASRRVQVWYPVDPSSRPGGVTALSFRYTQPIKTMLWDHGRHGCNLFGC